VLAGKLTAEGRMKNRGAMRRAIDGSWKNSFFTSAPNGCLIFLGGFIFRGE